MLELPHYFKSATAGSAACFFWFATNRMFTERWMEIILRECEREWTRRNVDARALADIGADTLA